jgi:hypothetical protein
MTQLIQCPFCGSLTAPHIETNHGLGHDDGDYMVYTVVCDASPKLGGCGGTCGFQETEEEAIEAWNKRCEE